MISYSTDSVVNKGENNMLILLIIAMVMIGLHIWIMYLELKPYLDAIENKKGMMLPIAMVVNLPKLIPIVIDITAVVVMGYLFSLGAGLIGGVTSLFASIIVSFIIYCRRYK